MLRGNKKDENQRPARPLVREPGEGLMEEEVEGWTEMMFPFSVFPLCGRKIWDSGEVGSVSGEVGSVSDLVPDLLGELGLRFLI